MLKKRHHQRDEIVRNYEVWRMLSCNTAVFVVFAICNVESRLLVASAGVSKLEYYASVSCRRTKGKLVLYWL